MATSTPASPPSSILHPSSHSPTFSTRAARRVPSVSPLLSLAAIAVFFVPGLAERLQYDRAAGAAEWWRFATCHWTHWTTDHLIWDVAMFALLGIACEMRSLPRFLTCLAASALLIPAGVAVFLPNLQTYRGLSGIDSALFTLLAVDLLRERRARWIVAALLVAFAAKIIFECLTRRAFFVESATMESVPLAHGLGAACGGVTALFTTLNKSQ